jgi:2-hydroxy-6-oxonona-2,4-dienedioate hydrolase
MKQPLRSRYDKVHGWKVHSRSAYSPRPGSCPVVLVHGLSQSSRYFFPLAEQLGQNFDVYALDFPGYGLSDKPDHTLSIAEMADLLAAWMTVLHIDKACIVGNSMGCNVIAEMALRHPARIHRAVLVGPTVDKYRRSAPQQILRTIAAAFHEEFSIIPRVLLDYTLAGIRRSFTALNHVLTHSIEDLLPLMEMPTLVIRGENDPLSPQDWVEEVVRLLPDGRLAVLPVYGHGVHYSLSRETAQLVGDFLLG